MLPTLVRKLQDKETVVFHCALSQQRGPSAALHYIREREHMFPAKEATPADGAKAKAGGGAEGGDGETGDDKPKPAKQKVYVLDRGFVGWQEDYGADERLTEGYRKELWADGYWG
jgi:hypothetical protein